MRKGCQEPVDVILMRVNIDRQKEGSDGEGEKFTDSDVQEEQMPGLGD